MANDRYTRRSWERSTRIWAQPFGPVTRRTSEKADAMPPKTSRIASAAGSSSLAGSRPLSATNAISGCSIAWWRSNKAARSWGAGARLPRRNLAEAKGLLLRRVAKGVKNTRRRGDGPDPQRAVDPGSQLLLGKELLESTLSGDQSVAVEVSAQSPSIPLKTCSDHEDPPRESPSGSENKASLLWVFDHVDHVAQIDDICGRPSFVWEKGGVPSVDRQTHLVKALQITTSTTPVVEERSLSGKKAILKGQCHRSRQRQSPHGGSVRSNSSHHLTSLGCRRGARAPGKVSLNDYR